MNFFRKLDPTVIVVTVLVAITAIVITGMTTVSNNRQSAPAPAPTHAAAPMHAAPAPEPVTDDACHLITTDAYRLLFNSLDWTERHQVGTLNGCTWDNDSQKTAPIASVQVIVSNPDIYQCSSEDNLDYVAPPATISVSFANKACLGRLSDSVLGGYDLQWVTATQTVDMLVQSSKPLSVENIETVAQEVTITLGQ